MSQILCHIVGLDGTRKKSLIDIIGNKFKIIDLDIIQLTIYNGTDITNQKKLWTQISNEINIKKKQRNLIINTRTKPSKSNQPNTNIIDTEIKNLMIQRNNYKTTIHKIWKEKLTQNIDTIIKSIPISDKIIIIGFNIFPKDYRVRVNLPLADYSKKIIYGTSSESYAENQIKYYYSTFIDKIRMEQFPPNLIKHKYVRDKYDKFTAFYEKIGYETIPDTDIIDIIFKLDFIKKHLELVGGNNCVPVNNNNCVPANSNNCVPIDNNIWASTISTVELIHGTTTTDPAKNNDVVSPNVKLISNNIATPKCNTDNITISKPFDIELIAQTRYINSNTNTNSHPPGQTTSLASPDKIVYVATVYKCIDTIPVNTRTPIEGFLSKKAAIDSIKKRFKTIRVFYLYEVSAEHFQFANGKLFAINHLYPKNEKSMLLTVKNP